MARRDYKTGSVYQRASDGLWLGTIEAGYTKTGGRRRITVSHKPTGNRKADEAAIKRKLRDKRLQIEKDGLPSTDTRATIKAWSEVWLEMTRPKLRRGPWATDDSAVRQWIVPTIGHRRLDQLTPADVRAVATAQRKAGRSTSTARRTHTTLTSMIRAAMIEGHPIPARVLLVEAPAIAPNDRDEMPAAEALLVLSAAHELLPHWSLWFMQILYGLRPAEVLGATEGSLDEHRLLVEWQLQPLPYIDRDNKALGFRIPEGMKVRHLVDAYHLTPPKTSKGFRSAPLVPAMRDALDEWLPQRAPNPWGLIWPNAAGRPANEKHNLEEWYALQDTVGVRHPSGRHYYLYEARHGFATRLMEEGADTRVIEELMGHSSIVTSRGYMHVKQKHALEVMEKIAARLELG